MASGHAPVRRPRLARRRRSFRQRLAAFGHHPATRNLLLGIGGGLGWATGEHLFRALPKLKRLGRIIVPRRIGF